MGRTRVFTRTSVLCKVTFLLLYEKSVWKIILPVWYSCSLRSLLDESFLFIAKFARWIIHLANFAMNRNIRRVKLFSLNVRYNRYKLEETWVTGWVKFVQTDWHEIATFGKWLIVIYSVFKESHDGWRLGTYQYLTLMIFLVIRKYISYLNNTVII